MLWFSVFTVVSCYSNCGFGLLASSMIPFKGTPVVLFFAGLAVVAGNTMLPVFLRWTLQVDLSVMKRNSVMLC